MLFKDLNLAQEVLDGLRDVGFEETTPIQEKCIPMILEGKDVLATAQTGTGKTAAFAIPVLNKVFLEKKEGIRALVITPTRELAKQVDEQFWSMGYHTGITTATVYGGDDWSQQSKALHKGVDVIVATPGRLLDQMKVKQIDFSKIDFFILDEADRMLDMGFIPDIMKIMRAMPEKRQNLMFSATMPPKIKQLVNTMMNNPEHVAMATNKPAEGINQMVYNVSERDKLQLTLSLYESMNWSSAIIFTSTKRNADVLARELKRKGASVTSIHGDRTQEEREAALKSFAKGEFKIIVATDVISRGIDIDNISHVVNYSVPRDVEDYVHRVGRTARAKSKGDAITFVSGADRRYIAAIYKELGDNITTMDMPTEFTGNNKSDESDTKVDSKKPQRKSGDRRSSQKTGRRKPKVENKTADKKSAEKPDSGDSKKDDKPVSKRTSGNKNTRPPRGKSKQKADDKEKAPPKKARGRKPAKSSEKNQGKKPADKGASSNNRRRNTRKPGKPSNKKNDQTSSRRDLIEKVQSPDMNKIEKKIEKSQEKKGNIWGFVKKIFNTSD